MESTPEPITRPWSDPGVETVAPGVHRIPLPLPGDGLKAVNVYAVDDGAGLTLVDSGWGIREAREALEVALADLDRDLGSVRRFLVTHVHRDHYELGLEVRRLFGARVALGRGEEPSLAKLIDRPAHGMGPMRQRLEKAGAGPLLEVLDQVRGSGGSIRPWELPDEWLQTGDEIDVAGRTLEVLETPGHTQGHVVFVDRANGLLFAGDHVLPHITPSIGFEQVPARSPLGDYLTSLALIRALPDLAMLPAHGPVQPTTHDRVDALVAHHDHRLDVSHDAVAAGATTSYEVATRITWTRRERRFDELDLFNQMLAVNETAAHLDVLVERERLTVQESDGTRHYAA
jgi:glyoxylase-like metal-dependent hydrolase (beta-lactamase superfamily II)